MARIDASIKENVTEARPYQEEAKITGCLLPVDLAKSHRNQSLTSWNQPKKAGTI